MKGKKKSMQRATKELFPNYPLEERASEMKKKDCTINFVINFLDESIAFLFFCLSLSLSLS